MSRAQIPSLVEQLAGIMETLNGADPYHRAAVYGQLELRLTDKPAEHVVQAEARSGSPSVKDGVRGGSRTIYTWSLSVELTLGQDAR